MIGKIKKGIDRGGEKDRVSYGSGGGAKIKKGCQKITYLKRLRTTEEVRNSPLIATTKNITENHPGEKLERRGKN